MLDENKKGDFPEIELREIRRLIEGCRCIKVQGSRKQVTVYAFVIMPNHLHLIWQIHDDLKREDFQRDFLKFTAKHILSWLSVTDVLLHKLLKVDAADRSFQVWEWSEGLRLFGQNILKQPAAAGKMTRE